MEDNTQLLYKTLTDKGLYTKTYDEFVSKYSNSESRRLMFDVVSKEGLYTKTYEEFTGKYFPEVKKKVSTESPLESATKGETVLQELGLPSKESITPKLPFQEPKKEKVKQEETFASEPTVTSVLKSRQKIPEYLQGEQERVMEESTQAIKDELTKLRDNYQKKIEANPEKQKELNKQFEEEQTKIIELRSANIPIAIESLYKKGKDYKRLDPTDVKGLSEMAKDIASKPVDYIQKKDALEGLKKDFMAKVGTLSSEEQSAIEKELNDVIAQSSVINDKGVPSVFGWKNEVSDKNTKVNQRIEELSKLPVTEDTKAEYNLLYRAQKYYERIMKLPDDEGNFYEGFKSEGRNMLTAGMAELFDAANIRKISKKQADGEPLDKGEQTLYDAYGIFQTAQNAEQFGKGYERGKGVAGSVAFMESFALTGGLAGIGEKTALKMIGNQVKSKVVQNIAKGVGSAVVRTPLLTGGMTETAKRMAGSPKLTETGEFKVDPSTIEPTMQAIGKGLYSNFANALGETAGGWLAGTKVSKFIGSALGINKIPKSVAKVFNTIGMQPLGELPEEYLTTLMETPVMGDQTLKEAFSPEAVWETAVQVGLMSGFFSGIALPSVVNENMNRSNNKALIDIFGKDNISSLRDAIESNDKVAFSDAMKQAFIGITQENIKGVSIEDAQKMLVKYANSLAQKKGAEVAQEAANIESQESAEDTFKKNIIEPSIGEMSGTQKGRIRIISTEDGGISVKDPTQGTPTELKSTEDAEVMKQTAIDDIGNVNAELEKRKVAKESNAPFRILGNTYATKEEFMQGFRDTFGGQNFDAEIVMSDDVQFDSSVSLTEIMGVIDEVTPQTHGATQEVPLVLRSSGELKVLPAFYEARMRVADNAKKVLQSKPKNDGVIDGANEGVSEGVNEGVKPAQSTESIPLVEEKTDGSTGEKVVITKEIKPKFDKGGDLTDESFDELSSTLVSIIDKVSEETGIPSKAIKKHFYINDKGEYFTSQQPLLDVGKSTNFERLIQTIKDVAVELNPKEADRIINTVNSIKQEWLNALQNDTPFEIPKEIGDIYNAINKIGDEFRQVVAPKSSLEETTKPILEENNNSSGDGNSSVTNTNPPQEGDSASTDSKQGENQRETTKVIINPIPIETNPNKLADEVKDIEWYHGTKSGDLTKGIIDPWAYGDTGSLVGLGLYTTADTGIARKYAGQKGRVFKFKFNPSKVINGDAPLIQDVIDAYKKSFTNDSQVDWGDVVDDYIKNNPKASLVELHKAILEEAINNEVSKDSVTEMFQEVAFQLSELGYDGITHEGGKALNQKTRHRVLILLDPESVYKTEKTNIISSRKEYIEPIQAPNKEEVRPPKPLKVTEGKETVEEDGEKKPLGAQENALDQIETEQQQILSDIVNENKEFYNVLHGEQAIKDANKFIEERGIDGAVEDLINKTTDINDYPTRQVARMVMIDHFTRILGNSQETKANKDRAYNLVNKLQQVLSKEANKTGQGNAHLNLWKVMQPAGLLEFTKRKIADFNNKKLSKKYKGSEKTIGQLIDLIYSNINEANKKIIDDILEGKTFEAKIPEEKPNQPRKPAKVRTVPKEQVVAEKNYRKNLLDEYKAKKKQGGAGQLNSSMPLSIEQMELGGNLIASYVRQGYYQVADIIERLKKDFDSVGDKIDDTQVDEILSSKKEGKTTYRSWLTAQEAKVGLKGEMKSLKIKISDIVKMHWSERDVLGRTLAQKLIDDAGLTDSEAKVLEKAILDEYDSMIKERLDSFKELTDLLGKEKIPTEAKKKLSVMDKMLQMINLGALDENVFRQLFAEKFGLAPELDRNQSNIIMQKAAIVQQMTGKGWFYRDAVIDMAKYMYELVPRKAMNEIAETWTALAYTHMLSGIPTSILNLWSAGTNMALKPFRDAVNLSRWLKMIKGRNTKGISDFYMPGGQMYYLPLLEGIGHGATEAAEIYANGDVTSKYVEEISTANQFKVGQLERHKNGKDRFKPLNIKAGKKVIDLNPYNYEKYVSRNLSAQDRLMFNTAFDMEVAAIIRENLISPTLRGKELTKAVMEYIQGNKIDKKAISAQIEKESKEYEELSGKKVTDRQKKIRLRELIVKELPITEEEKQETEALARSNIFTDERGGMVATLAYAIGRVANAHPLTGVIMKAPIPFTKIVGNVLEYMIDYTPFYGFMRANGMSISAIKKLVDPLSMTAQMGDKGSRLYYEQMGRAWLGTMSFLTVAAMFIGNDDDDDIQISGGYNQEGFKKPGRTNVMPKYTIRIKGVDISYLNIPALAIPLGIIGNFNDALKAKMPEEELSLRLAISILTAAPKENPLFQTMFMVKDMSFVTGVQNLITMISDAVTMEESNYKRLAQGMAKTYLGFALRPLPQNTAIVQQTWKFFDPASYSQKDIQSIIAYSAGLQHFRTLEINFPSIDQFGDEVRTYPGEALMPYTFWFDVKGKDARWRFLADNNAIPTKVQNGLTYIETEDGIEKRTMEAKELYLYSREVGNIFNKSVSDYMSDSKKIEKRKNDRITTEDIKLQSVTKTGIQEDIDGLWKDARDEAKIRVFSWYDFKKNNEVGWQKMVEEGVLQAPITSTEDVRVDEKEVLDFSREEVQTINDNAMTYYSEWVIKYLNTPKSKEDKSTPVLLADGGQTTVFEKQISEMWAGAKRRAKGELIEKKTKGK